MDNADALPRQGRTADGAAVSQFGEFPRLRANFAKQVRRWNYCATDGVMGKRQRSGSVCTVVNIPPHLRICNTYVKPLFEKILSFIFNVLLGETVCFNGEKYDCSYFCKIYIIRDLPIRGYVLQIRKLAPN